MSGINDRFPTTAGMTDAEVADRQRASARVTVTPMDRTGDGSFWNGNLPIVNPNWPLAMPPISQWHPARKLPALLADLRHNG